MSTRNANSNSNNTRRPRRNPKEDKEKRERGPAPENPERQKNNVQVGKNRNNFVFADLTKHLLAGGEATVEITALGHVIADAVAVAEMLKNQGMVKVVKIETSRGTEAHAHRDNADKISIHVAKSADFDAKYKAQQAEREERKAKGEDKAE